MGFEDTGVFRQPNSWVKYSLMKVLGLTYDSEVVAEGSLDLDSPLKAVKKAIS